jgi:hypothetical protein
VLQPGAPAGYGGYLVRDTPWQDMGGGEIRFDRISHNIPPDRTYPLIANKSLLFAQYTYLNGVLNDIGIINFTDDVDATVFVHYAMFNPGASPRKPTIMIIPILGSLKYITDAGTGFPNSGGLYTNNRAPSYLGGSVENVIGQLWCIKKIYG